MFTYSKPMLIYISLYFVTLMNPNLQWKYYITFIKVLLAKLGNDTLESQFETINL